MIMYQAVRPTVLARQLVSGPPDRPTPLDAFNAARRVFMAGERIEMQVLAAELGISRVTLHRWVGSRDALLGEVLWSLAEPTLRESRRTARTRGGAGIAETFWRFTSAVHAAPFMRSFLIREPEIALRVLTTSHAPVQARLTNMLREMLIAEVDAGRLDPPMQVEDLAYVIVRLGESFVYTDLITGGQPAPDKVRQAIVALLR
jgi:AcrR family transcriptional regulator